MNAAAEQVSTEAPEELTHASSGVVLTDHTAEAGNDAYNVKADGLNAELATKWLVWQCRMIADVITGVVFDANGNMLAMRPIAGVGADKLAIAGQQAFENDKPVIHLRKFKRSSGRYHRNTGKGR